MEYADLASDVMKDCVRKAGNTVKRQRETSNVLEVVHSRERCQLTHLLKKGHAKRGGAGSAVCGVPLSQAGGGVEEEG